MDARSRTHQQPAPSLICIATKSQLLRYRQTSELVASLSSSHAFLSDGKMRQRAWERFLPRESARESTDDEAWVVEAANVFSADTLESARDSICPKHVPPLENASTCNSQECEYNGKEGG
jgi:hypothetical protein